MRVFQDNTEYQGTPYEIAEFFRLANGTAESEPSFASDDFEPLQDIVSESEDLRRKLTNDPNYNPFPGVVTSKETENTDPNPAVGFAEMDTGVQK